MPTAPKLIQLKDYVVDDDSDEDPIVFANRKLRELQQKRIKIRSITPTFTDWGSPRGAVVEIEEKKE